MKCQHCGSDDIVAIQGAHFCLNCGSKVDENQQIAKPVMLNAPKPKAKNKTVKSKEVKITRPVVSPEHDDRGELSRRVLASASNDSSKPVAAPLDPAARLPRAHFNARAMPRTSRRSVHPLRFSGITAIISGGLLGLSAGGLLTLNVHADIALYCVGVATLSLVVGVGLSQSALMYGVSRRDDGRPAPHSHWWAAARSGFMDVVNLNIGTFIAMLVVIGVAGIGTRGILTASALPFAVHVGVLGLINVAAVWSLLGLYVARRVGAPAIIIGGLTAWAAFKIGWKLYWKAGGHLVAALLEVIFLRLTTVILILALLLVLGVRLTNSSANVITAGLSVGIGVAVGVAVFVLLELESRLWLHQYRSWVVLLSPAERVRLLTGRTSARSQ